MMIRFQRRGRSRGELTGFTLVEALVTVVIFSIISGACLMIFLSGSDTWQTNDVQVELQQELRKAMEWIKGDLLEAGSTTVVNVPVNGTWYTTITFRKSAGVSGGNISWSNTLQYLVGGSGVQLLRRPSGGSDRIIAQDIQSVQFRRTTTNLVEVSLQAQKNTVKGRPLSDQLNFTVKLRN